MADISLTFDSAERVYDISIADNGDIATDDSFNTAIIMSVHGEKRASAAEIVRPEFRRGSWQNELSDVDGYEVGSKYWLLESARSNQESLNFSITTLEDAFQWMIDDNLLKEVNVDGILYYRGITNQVELVAPNNTTEVKLFESWLDTGD